MEMSVRNPHQLLLAKNLFEDSRLLIERDDAFSHTKAVILLDLAIEMVLNNIVLNFDPDLTINASKGSQDTDRRTLWGNAVTALNKAKGKRLPESREMANLHALRNLVQHNGTEPTQAEAKRYLAAAALLMDNAFKNAYELNFESFRIWDFVRNVSLRRWMLHHEDQLNSNPVRCIAGCQIAFESVVHSVSRKTTAYTSHRTAGDRVKQNLSGNFTDYAAQKALGVIAKELEELQTEIVARSQLLESEIVTVGVGVPVMDTRRFIISYDGIFVANFGRGKFQIAISRESIHEEEVERATYMLNYMSRLIRLIDEGYPGVLDGLKLELEGQEQ